MVYLLAFVVCMSLSMLSTWYVRNLANAKGWTDVPKFERHVHTIPVPRLGGVAICFSFMSVVILALVVPPLLGFPSPVDTKAIVGLLGPALIVFLLGLVDDLRPVHAYFKFAIQGIAAILLYAGGYGIHNLGLIHGGAPLGRFYCLPLTVLWVLLITNAFNLIDGLDGLAAGSAFFSMVVVCAMSLIVPNSLVGFLTVALAGGILGFLRFNFHPASIFLGDSGSLFIGFMLAALALAGSEKAPTIIAVAIPMVSLGFPILDVVLAVVRRFLAGKPLFDGDKYHIHHRLLKRGLSQRGAVLTLYAVTAGFGFLSLVLFQQRKATALVLAALGLGIFFGVQQLRYHEFEELVSILQGITQRRQIVVNHVAIRRATERLSECNDFGSICRLLQNTLGPMGFDAVRFKKLGQNGYSYSLLEPLSGSPDGSWVYSWFEREIVEPPWELNVELRSNTEDRWGYFSLICMSEFNRPGLDLNLLTGEFRVSLCRAITRASAQMEELEPVGGDDRNGKARVIAAGTMTD